MTAQFHRPDGKRSRDLAAQSPSKFSRPTTETLKKLRGRCMHDMNEPPSGLAHPFRNRREAGRILAQHLQDYAGRSDVVVLALPRGGVPVAFEIAKALHARLDVFVVRKLGVPGREELAMGAIASGGIRDLNEDVVCELRIPADIIES